MCDRRRESGQALLEFGIILPILLLIVIGVIEIGYALFQVQVITNLAREGSNLISRNHTIGEASTAIDQATTTGPVRIGPDAKVVFSVVTLGTTGANANQPIIVQRHSIGSLTVPSKIGEPPESSYNPARDYQATNPNDDANIRVSGPLPNGLRLTSRETLYVTEVFTRRTSIAPFIPLPEVLYAPAYF
jgi:hypothetical protein